MTDAFTPVSLRLTPEPPIAIAQSEDAVEFLTGPALRAVIAERIEQIEVHGRTPSGDALHDEAELALAGKSYVDTYIDLELRPDIPPATVPESWPWQNLFWKEPTPDQASKALVKGIALLLAELDRRLLAEELARAARPLIDYRPPADADPTPLHKRDWHG